MILKGVKTINIGIDIDGVINNLSLFHITCGSKFCYENNLDIVINENEMDSLNIFNWNKSIDNLFWQQYYLHLLYYPDYIRPFVSFVTHAFHDKGYNIYIISSRKDADLPHIEKNSMHSITEKYLTNANIFYNAIFLTDNKWERIHALKIDFMIEDNPIFFSKVPQIESVKLMCFSTPYNQKVYGKNVIRVHSWHDILHKIDDAAQKEDTYEYK